MNWYKKSLNVFPPDLNDQLDRDVSSYWSNAKKRYHVELKRAQELRNKIDRLYEVFDSGDESVGDEIVELESELERLIDDIENALDELEEGERGQDLELGDEGDGEYSLQESFAEIYSRYLNGDFSGFFDYVMDSKGNYIMDADGKYKRIERSELETLISMLRNAISEIPHPDLLGVPFNKLHDKINSFTSKELIDVAKDSYNRQQSILQKYKAAIMLNLRRIFKIG
jgi:hypothetical protein